MTPQTIQAFHSRVASHRDAIISFLRDIVAIPSFDSNIRDVAVRVERELRTLGFQDIHKVVIMGCLHYRGDVK